MGLPTRRYYHIVIGSRGQLPRAGLLSRCHTLVRHFLWLFKFRDIFSYLLSFCPLTTTRRSNLLVAIQPHLAVSRDFQTRLQSHDFRFICIDNNRRDKLFRVVNKLSLLFQFRLRVSCSSLTQPPLSYSLKEEISLTKNILSINNKKSVTIEEPFRRL